MTRVRLATRLVAILVGLLALVLVATSVTVVLVTRASLMAQLDDQIRDAAARGLDYAGPGRGHRPERNPVEAPGQQANLLIVVQGQNRNAGVYRDASGIVQDLPAGDLALITEGANSAPHTVRLSIGHYRVLALTPRGRSAASLVTAGLPTSTVDRPTATLALTAAAGSALALLAAGLIGNWLVRRELRPLARISAVAAGVAELPLESSSADLADRRVLEADATPETEVGQVGAALNQLLGRVDSSLRARDASQTRLKTFVADASHELRTPLTAIRGYTEMSRLDPDLPPRVAESLRRVDAQAVRMGSLVDDLLILARLDSGRPPALEPVLWDELVVEAVVDATAAGPDHHWHVDIADDDLTVAGDPRQLERLIANLLSNARVHTPAGTQVWTTLVPEDHEAVLTVRDDGPGMTPEFAERAFDRFARADESRSGHHSTGLGLAIVHGIVTAHGGTIAVESNAGGTTFEVRLPVLRQ